MEEEEEMTETLMGLQNPSPKKKQKQNQSENEEEELTDPPDQEEDQENQEKKENQNSTSRSDNFSVEEIYCMMKAHYGSIYNLFGLCGPGTYVCLGPTEAGKSFFIKQLYYYATSPLCTKEFQVNFETILALSSTAKMNDEYDWNPNILKIKPSNDAVNMILAERKKEIREECEKAGIPKSQGEVWAAAHPMLIYMDDTYGMVNFSVPGNSGGKLATKARHYGIWYVNAVQYVHQVGPLFHDNARTWICFSCNANSHKEIIERHHGKSKELLKVVTSFNRKEHHPVIYITTWRFRKHFGVNANRVLLMYPIKSIEKDIKHFEEIESHYKQFEQGDNDDSENDYGNKSS